MALKAPIITALIFLLASSLHTEDAGNRTAKGEEWEKFRTIYVFDATCREYIQAEKEKG